MSDQKLSLSRLSYLGTYTDESGRVYASVGVGDTEQFRMYAFSDGSERKTKMYANSIVDCIRRGAATGGHIDLSETGDGDPIKMYMACLRAAPEVFAVSLTAVGAVSLLVETMAQITAESYRQMVGDSTLRKSASTLEQVREWVRDHE